MAKGGFPGMGGANMQQLMRQAQKMQQDMQKKQEELNARTFSAGAGGGMVTAVVTGAKRVESVKIDPACVDPDDVEMLEDMVMAAVNEALRLGEETREKTMAALAPGGMGGLL